jgi:hypothetical protein
MQGLFGHRSAFIRTPKYAENKASATAYFSTKKKGMHYFELLMLIYFVAGIGASFYLGDYFFLLLFVMMSSGLAILVWQSFNWRTVRLPILWSKLRWRRLLFLFKYE